MSAFAAAAEVLAADANLTSEAIWTAKDGGPPETVAVIVSAPDTMSALDVAPVLTTDALIHVTVATLSDVGEGDTFQIGTDLYHVQAAQRDAEGVTWVLPCRRRTEATTGSVLLGNGL